MGFIRDIIASLREKKKSAFTRNSRMLLGELCSTYGHNINPIQFFSAKELKKATNNYNPHQIIAVDRDYILYKGLLQDRPISVKKFKDQSYYYNDPIKEIVFSSVCSWHNNILNLLGCCLDTDLPILVFEYARNGTLNDYVCSANGVIGASIQPLTWQCRLKIAIELCEAVEYLHKGFPKPIIHRDIKPQHIFLGENNSVKLFNFSLSTAIPDGDYEVEDTVCGTVGYLAPEYMTSGCFDEKIDVYSFGVVLLQLLTGQKAFDLSRSIDEDEYFLDNLVRRKYTWVHPNINEIVDNDILEEGLWPEREKQLLEFGELALLCCSTDVQARPTMIEVFRQLNCINSVSNLILT